MNGDTMMDKAMSAALMADFAAEAIGHKPATWCRNCAETVRQRKGKSCGDHKVIRCPKCRTNITDAHTCLDFVGHADVRARLCDVDPEWTWEPFDFPGTGSLVLSDGQPVGLWIKLTVGGVSKPGYGSVDKGKAEAMKELIGDALRNAGLSFGIAWKLWAKGERTGGDGEQDSGNANAQPASDAWDNAAPARPANGSQRGGQANGSSRPAGQVSRPAQKPAGPAATGEPDPDAQGYADEAHEARTLTALRDIQTRARKAHKLAAFIRNPATGNVGGLGQLIEYHRKRLAEIDTTLRALNEAAGATPIDELEAHVRKVTGASIEDATAAQIRQAAESLRAVAAA